MKALTYIERGKYDIIPLIPHRYRLENIEKACILSNLPRFIGLNICIIMA